MRKAEVIDNLSKVLPGLDSFSGSQKARIRDLFDIEVFEPKHSLIQENVQNHRAYIILKGEIEI